MSESVKMAIELLGQGMAGIFTVLIVIALIVALLGRMDKRPPKQ
ncbi:OadG-related small transporter subunit [Agathobaculum sp.]|nr:OadG-related small transporter subunit [Agathobaculum sp.]